MSERGRNDGHPGEEDPEMKAISEGILKGGRPAQPPGSVGFRGPRQALHISNGDKKKAVSGGRQAAVTTGGRLSEDQKE